MVPIRIMKWGRGWFGIELGVDCVRAIFDPKKKTHSKNECVWFQVES